MEKISPDDLILNEDGSLYHINLLPGEAADRIIFVGDPERVPQISRHFDRIELKKFKREFLTHTGYIGDQRLTVMSTGMGVGSIDIALNELDALFNVDLKSRCVKPERTKLKILRLGTCGGLAPEVPVDSLIVSECAFGFDGVVTFYKGWRPEVEEDLLNAIRTWFMQIPAAQSAYVAHVTPEFAENFMEGCYTGMTFTCSGFYAPQRRALRLRPITNDVLALAQGFRYEDHRVVNFEMETSAIYGLCRLLDYDYCSISAVVAQRALAQVSKAPQKIIDKMIIHGLEGLLK